MQLTGLTELIAAQRAYSAARNQAIQAAQAAKTHPADIANLQRQSLLKYLQNRVEVLTQASDAAVAQFQKEIARYQQKIDALLQVMQDAAKAQAAVPQKTAPQPKMSPKKKT